MPSLLRGWRTPAQLRVTRLMLDTTTRATWRIKGSCSIHICAWLSTWYDEVAPTETKITCGRQRSDKGGIPLPTTLSASRKFCCSLSPSFWTTFQYFLFFFQDCFLNVALSGDHPYEDVKKMAIIPRNISLNLAINQ